MFVFVCVWVRAWGAKSLMLNFSEIFATNLKRHFAMSAIILTLVES